MTHHVANAAIAEVSLGAKAALPAERLVGNFPDLTMFQVRRLKMQRTLQDDGFTMVRIVVIADNGNEALTLNLYGDSSSCIPVDVTEIDDRPPLAEDAP